MARRDWLALIAVHSDAWLLRCRTDPDLSQSSPVDRSPCELSACLLRDVHAMMLLSAGFAPAAYEQSAAELDGEPRRNLQQLVRVPGCTCTGLTAIKDTNHSMFGGAAWPSTTARGWTRRGGGACSAASTAVISIRPACDLHCSFLSSRPEV